MRTWLYFMLCLVCVVQLFFSGPGRTMELAASLILLLAILVSAKYYFIDRRNLKTICNFYQHVNALDDLLLLNNARPYQKILRIVADLGQFDWAVLFMMDFEQNRFVAAESCGIDLKDCAQISFDEIGSGKDHVSLSLLLLDHAFNRFELKGALAGSAIERNNTFYGCLLVGRHDPEASLSEEDNLRLKILSDQISVTLHNYQMHQELNLRAEQLTESQMLVRKELAMAKIVQDSAITIIAPDFPGLECASFVRPARFVGGDFLKFYPDEAQAKMAMLIGDVCGKGVPAALIMSVVLCLFQEKKQSWCQPEALLAEVNLSLKEFIGAGSHINSSAVFVVFSLTDKMLYYANAGHEFPFHFNQAKDSLEVVPSTGTLLGIFNESEFTARQIQLGSGDRFYFYSDGLIDFFEVHEKVEDGFSVLEEFVFKRRHKKPEEIVNEIKALVEKDSDLKDDITFAVVAVK